MMGYYLTNPNSVVSFPVARRYGSNENNIERTNLVHETDRGKRWVYKQVKRRTRDLTFRLTLAQLVTFETLDTAVNGDEIAFYFVPVVGASPLNAIYVRKEKDFKPEELKEVASVSGVKTRMFDYTLHLTEEPSGVEVQP